MPDSNETNSAIKKAIKILETVGSNNRAINLSDIASQIGLPRQTVHRIASQLVELGLLFREPVRERYSLGRRFNKIALDSLVISAQQPNPHTILVDLVESIQETCNLGVLDNTEVLYLDRVECHWPLRLQLKSGSRVQAYPTAIGKLLMANLDTRSQLRLLEKIELQKLTDHTILDVDRILGHFAEIRMQGYSVNRQEDYVGLVAIAVPIRNEDGQIVAGLGVHAPLPRLPYEDIPVLLPKLYSAAESIGKALIH